MKKMKFILAFFMLAFLSSCLDTVEDIVLNEDESGVYTMSVDMGKMLEIAKDMGAGKSDSKKPKEKKDTTVNISHLMATAENITAAEKELYKDATMHVKLDEENAEMKIVMRCPFASINQLPEIKKNFFKLTEKVNAFDKLTNKASKEEAKMTEDMPNNVLIPSADSHHNFTAKSGVIENSITDIEGYKKEMQADSSLTMMQQMMSMTGEPSYKITITTAKEIKKFTGNGAVLSPNKKTVTFTNSFNEMVEHPEKLGYKIEF